jgi:hypothetical protein
MLKVTVKGKPDCLWVEETAEVNTSSLAPLREPYANEIARADPCHKRCAGAEQGARRSPEHTLFVCVARGDERSRVHINES